MSTKSNSERLVCVTGASGFIAGHAVRELLEKGYRVRGTVRGAAAKYPHLTSMKGAAERLELVSADLQAEGAYDAAVKDCEFVIHTASPFILTVKDSQRDLVDPAVKGTTNVLASCKKAGTVKRVVLTSSMAAVTDEPDTKHVYTEADWNEKSSLGRNPYYYSKTMAERAGWQFMTEQKPSFDLVVINPYMVIGPSFTDALNPSNQIFVDVLNGVYPGIMGVEWGFVDVRDVAHAHVLAMETPGAGGRNLCVNQSLPMRQVVEFLRKQGYAEGYKLPKLDLSCSIGDFAVKMSSYLQPKGIGDYLRTHVGKVLHYDCSKIKRELGLSFRPIEQTLTDTLADLERWGHIKPLSRDDSAKAVSGTI